jgi:hypothetical protein
MDNIYESENFLAWRQGGSGDWKIGGLEDWVIRRLEIGVCGLWLVACGLRPVALHPANKTKH